MDATTADRLMVRAGRLLSRRAFGRAELAARLGRTAPVEAVDAVVDRLERLGLLNDASYAYNFALQRLTREGWGLRRIRRALVERQVARDVVDLALERVSKEIGEEAALVAHVQRRVAKQGLPADRRGIRRLAEHLARRGFSVDSTERVLRRLIPADAWRDFDRGE